MKNYYYATMFLWILSFFTIGSNPDWGIFFHLFAFAIFMVCRFLYKREENKKQKHKNEFTPVSGNDQAQRSNSRILPGTALNNDRLQEISGNGKGFQRELQQEQPKARDPKSNIQIQQDTTENSNSQQGLSEKGKEYQRKLQQMRKEYEERVRIEKETREMELQRESKEFREKQTDSEDPALNDINDLLRTVSEHIFPGGKILAGLDGQRQLFIWLCFGVPCLRGMPETQAGTAFMDPDLPDDPEIFLPYLDSVISEVLSVLSEKYDGNWSGSNPEELTGGWFALKMYAKMSTFPEIFLAAADDIAAYMKSSPEAMSWLQENIGQPVFPKG